MSTDINPIDHAAMRAAKSMLDAFIDPSVKSIDDSAKATLELDEILKQNITDYRKANQEIARAKLDSYVRPFYRAFLLRTIKSFIDKAIANGALPNPEIRSEVNAPEIDFAYEALKCIEKYNAPFFEITTNNNDLRVFKLATIDIDFSSVDTSKYPNNITHT